MAKDQLKVVGLGGSLAQRSTSLAALRIALEGAAEAEATTELLDIKKLALPMYDPAARNPPETVIRMCDAVYQANGLIWSSPMYNGTISGSFKNALDWLILLRDRHPPYLTDKVVGLISTAGGVQGLQAVNTMEFVVRALRGWAVPLVMPIAQAWKAFDENGAPQQSELSEQLRALGREVARGSCQFALEPPTKEDAMRAEAEVAPLTDDEASTAWLQLGERARKQAGLNPSLLDLDGTLIESVYQHVLAWSETLHKMKINLPPANRKGMTYVGEASRESLHHHGYGREHWPRSRFALRPRRRFSSRVRSAG